MESYIFKPVHINRERICYWPTRFEFYCIYSSNNFTNWGLINILTTFKIVCGTAKLGMYFSSGAYISFSLKINEKNVHLTREALIINLGFVFPC